MEKTESISDWIDIYQLPIGAIGFCVAQMLVILRELANEEAVALAEEADRKHDRASQLKYDWEQQKQQDPLTSDEARKLDNRIDRTLSLIHQGAEVYSGLEEASRKKQLADEFLDRLFPSGVFPITSLSFTEQHGAVQTLTERLNGEFSEHVDAFDLEPMVDQLATLNEEFGAMLQSDANQVAYDEVEAAYVEAEEAFHELLLKVLCDYRSDLETLNRVMAPVHKQTEMLSRHLKRRGGAPEVDPETGEPVEPTDGDNSPVNDGGSSTDDEDSTNESDGDETSETDSSGDGESSGDGDES